jgi:glucose/arabinose dehydrogenase
MRPSDGGITGEHMLGKSFLATVATVAFLALAPAAQAGTPVAGFTDTPVVTGLSVPTGMAFLPGSGGLLIVEKGGALKLATGTGPPVTLATLPVCTASEMGLLGVAVDPNFTSNGFIYLYRSAPDSNGSCADAVGRFNQVVRVTMTGSTVSLGSLTVLLTGIRTDNGNHDGGTLRIGPADGKLYVSVGDSGIGDGGSPGSSTNPYAQDLGELNGKILRLELDGSPAAGNPFIGTPGARPEIFAYGFRNPFRMGFDKQTGRLWAGDVGQSSFEELDIVTAGGNYSWPRCEGTEPPGCMTEPDDVAPIFTYPLSGTGSLGRTIIGGDFAPAGFGPYAGDYFFADNYSSKIYRADVNAARTDIFEPVQEFVTGASGPTDLVFTPGALYYVSINSGEVRQVTQPEPYPRPGSATPVRVPLAPAYAECTSPNSSHVPPLTLFACTPPVRESQILTTSSLGRGSGFVRLRAIVGNPATIADEADLAIDAGATDVVCAATSASCPGGAGSDYAGDVALVLQMRLTDRRSGVFEGVPASANTAVGFPVACAANTNANLGGACSLSTTADTVVPGFAREERRTILDLLRIRIIDPGLDGTLGADCPPFCGNGDEGVYVREALFAP